MYIYIFYIPTVHPATSCGVWTEDNDGTIQPTVFHKKRHRRTSKCPDALRKQLRTYVWQSHVMLGTGTTTLGDARARGWTPE